MSKFIDRTIKAVSPKWAASREKNRLIADMGEKIRGVKNQGYGSHGASMSRTALKAFNPGAGSAKEDIIDNLPTLRSRARDLYMGGAIPNAALKAIRTNVVGPGMKVKPTPDAAFLNLNPEQAANLTRQIEREWALWAESKDCDALGIHNFYELQQIAFISEMMSGDVFGLLTDMPRDHATYDLRIKLVEADRCTTPTPGLDGVTAEKLKNVQSGIEVDEDGLVVAYWFSDRHLKPMEAARAKFVRIPARGEASGRRNVLHLMSAERPDQRRGVPLIAPVIEQLKQLERFMDAELMKSVISSYMTVFVKMSETTNPDELGFEVPVANPNGEPLARPMNELGLGSGTIEFLEPGEEIQIAESKSPNSNYDAYVNSNVRQVGAALELPYEVMIKSFTSSYSASRGALLEAQKAFKMRRSWLASDFCQPIFEEWFAEAVIAGRIDAPGFFDDELIRKAYVSAEWNGPSYGMLDPTKEVNAAILRVQHAFSNSQKEAAEMTGTQYEPNLRQLAHEKQLREFYGIEPVTPLVIDGSDETEQS